MPEALLFDAYGTLFDVYAIGAQLEAWYPGKGEAAATLLRDKQIEYTRLITQSDPSPGGSRFYEPFRDLTIKALRYTSKSLALAHGRGAGRGTDGCLSPAPRLSGSRRGPGRIEGAGLAPRHSLQRRSRACWRAWSRRRVLRHFSTT